MSLRLRIFMSALVVFGTVCFIFSRFDGMSPHSATARHPREQPLRALAPGSYNGLTAWSKHRSWPQPRFPSKGLQAGFEHVRKHLPAVEPLQKRETLWRPVPAARAGRSLALAFDPHQPGVLYAGSASGGLWVTDSADTTPVWRRVETGYPVLGVGAIALDPAQPDQVLIGTGEVYGFAESRPGVARRETRGSYGIGILKSRDAGRTWVPVLDWRDRQETGVQDLTYDPNQAGRVWAATSEGVFRSEDGGDHWALSLDVAMAVSLVVFPGKPGRILAACGGFASPDHGLYLSDDGGRSWRKQAQGLPETFAGKAMLHAAPSEPDTVYASIGNGHKVFTSAETSDNATWLCRSLDAGETWRIVNRTDYTGFQGWYSHFVHVAANDAHRLWLGGVGMNTSPNGGFGVLPFLDDTGLAQFADFHAMATSPHDPNVLYIAADQGLAYSRDNGATWQAANTGYQTLQFYNGTAVSRHQPNQLVGTVQDHFGSYWLVESESGPHMEQRFVGHEAGYVVLDTDDPNRYAVSGPFLTLFQGEGMDGFVAEPPVCPPRDTLCDSFLPDATASFNAPVVAAANQPGLLFAGRNTVWRSEDWGGSWMAGNDGLALGADPLLALAVAPTDPRVLYAASAPNHEALKVYTSDDGGFTWRDISLGLPNRYLMDFAIDPRSATRVTAVFSGFGGAHVYRSADGGANWRPLDGAWLPDVPTTAVVIDPEFPSHIYIGNDLGVFASLDDGYSWFSLTAGLPEAVLVGDLNLDPATRNLLVATHGNGVYMRPLLELLPRGGDAERPFVSVLGDLQHGSGVSTLIGIHNGGASATDLRLVGFTAAGAQVGISPLATRLAPGAQVLAPLDQWFANAPSAVTWARLESDRPLTAFAERGDADSRSAWLAQAPGQELVMPHIAKDIDQFQTKLFVVNPTTAGGFARLAAYPTGVTARADGLGGGLFAQTLDMAQVFGTEVRGLDWAQLEAGPDLAAVEQFRRLPGGREVAALSLRDQAATTLNFLHVAADTGQFWSGLVYLNPGDVTAEIKEESFDAEGRLLQTQLLSLGAKNKETLLFDQNSSANHPERYAVGTVWVRVQSSTPLIGYELFGAAADSNNALFAGIHSDAAQASRLLYPRLQSDVENWTGIVVVNTAETTVEVIAKAYDADGNLLAERPLDALGGFVKRTLLLRDVFPDQAGTAASLVLESERAQLAGFLLWGDHNREPRRFLAGLNAVRLE